MFSPGVILSSLSAELKKSSISLKSRIVRDHRVLIVHIPCFTLECPGYPEKGGYNSLKFRRLLDATHPGSHMGNIHTSLLLINTAWGESSHRLTFRRQCLVVGMIEGISNLELGDRGLSHSSTNLRFCIWGSLSFLSFDIQIYITGRNQSAFLGMCQDLMK